MPVAFFDLAQTCAPFVLSEAPAEAVGLQSRLAPFAIRIEEERWRGTELVSKSQANEISTSPAGRNHNIQSGHGGDEAKTLHEVRPLTSDPCLTPWTTLTPSNGGDGPIVLADTDERTDEQPISLPDQDHDAALVGAGEQIGDEVSGNFAWFEPRVLRVTAHDKAKGSRNHAFAPSALTDVIAEVLAENTQSRSASTDAAPAWDVFGRRPVSSVLVFQNNPME